ncbi:adnp homeobox 2, partial [Lasius niger]
MATSKEINSLKNYFTLDYEEIVIIKCDYCDHTYDIEISTEVIEHLKVHANDVGAVSSNTSEEDLKEYYEINNNTIKCKFCEKVYIPLKTHSIIKHHLGDGHMFKELTTDYIIYWLRDNNYRLDESTEENRSCNECGSICKNKPLSIIDHLRTEIGRA